jgi:lipid II:glycine glycyltransferase (peptidoglycan interpeptide bridge formation enzyme)
MLTIRYLNGIIPVTEKWFPAKISTLNSLLPMIYVNSVEKKYFIGFQRNEFLTKVIDLTLSEDALKSELNKDTQYDVRRSIKDGIKIEITDNWDFFKFFYNKFSVQKGLSQLNNNKIESIKRNATILCAKINDDTLVMHMYLTDSKAGYCRLLYSASQFRSNDDSSYRALIGRANRHLHWLSILHFKSAGYKLYDLGGYSRDTSNPTLNGINKFKDSFGGKFIIYSTYSSYTLIAMQNINRLIKSKLRLT